MTVRRDDGGDVSFIIGSVSFDGDDVVVRDHDGNERVTVRAYRFLAACVNGRKETHDGVFEVSDITYDDALRMIGGDGPGETEKAEKTLASLGIREPSGGIVAEYLGTMAFDDAHDAIDALSASFENAMCMLLPKGTIMEVGGSRGVRYLANGLDPDRLSYLFTASDGRLAVCGSGWYSARRFRSLGALQRLSVMEALVAVARDGTIMMHPSQWMVTTGRWTSTEMSMAMG